MFYFIFAAIVPLLSLTSHQSTPQADAGDLRKLQGFWKPVDIESKEKPRQPVLITKEDIIRHLRLQFVGNDYITLFGDEIQRQSFQLNQSTQPGSIDVTREVLAAPMAFLKAGEKAEALPPPVTRKEIIQGIYELKGDRLKICLPMSAKAERPKSFEAALAAGHDIMILERDTDKRAAFRLSDAQHLGELRRLGVDAHTSGHERDSGSIYVTIREGNADKQLEAIAPTLRKLSSVTGLHLYETNVTDAGLAHLKDVNNLGHINLSQTGITDAGLVHLTGMTKLHFLILNDTKVSDEGIARLKKALPRLEVEKQSKVQLDSEKAIQKAGGILMSDQSHLTGIELTRNSDFTDTELKKLEGPLNVWKDSLTDINLAGTGISDLGLKSLSSLHKLKTLDVRGTKVTSAGATELKRLIPGIQIKLTGDK